MKRGFRMRLTVPTVNQGWWNNSKKELTSVVEKYNRDMWPKEKDPVTLKPWKPRKPPTGTWPILKRTGTMQDTAKFRAGRNPLEFIVRTVYYGPFMQYGTRNVPARRWLGIGPKVLDPMGKVIAKNLFKKGKKTFRIP